MAILLLVTRGSLLALVYLFIAVILFYIVQDLKQTKPGAQPYFGDSNPDTKGYPGDHVAVGFGAAKTGAGILKVQSAPTQYNIEGVEIPLTDEISLGRDEGNDVILPGGFVSGSHARIYLSQGQYWLEDRGSTNGTLLNQVPIKKATVLANGDQIAIGDITLRFVRWGYEVG